MFNCSSVGHGSLFPVSPCIYYTLKLQTTFAISFEYGEFIVCFFTLQVLQCSYLMCMLFHYWPLALSNLLRRFLFMGKILRHGNVFFCFGDSVTQTANAKGITMLKPAQRKQATAYTIIKTIMK